MQVAAGNDPKKDSVPQPRRISRGQNPYRGTLDAECTDSWTGRAAGSELRAGCTSFVSFGSTFADEAQRHDAITTTWKSQFPIRRYAMRLGLPPPLHTARTGSN